MPAMEMLRPNRAAKTTGNRIPANRAIERSVIERNSRLMVQTGSNLLFRNIGPNTFRSNDDSTRVVRRRILFDEPFADQPSVILGLAGIDTFGAIQTTFNFTAEDVHPLGFVAVFENWGKTRIQALSANWMAIGASLEDGRQKLDLSDPSDQANSLKNNCSPGCE